MKTASEKIDEGTTRRTYKPKGNGANGHADVAGLLIPSMAAICEMDPIARPWFYGSFLTSGAFLITGRPKVGKSWLLMQLMIALAKGRDFLGFECTGPTECLYIGCEDDYSRIKSRGLALGDLPNGVRVVVREQLMQLAASYGERCTFVEFLRDYLRANRAVKAVIMDTEEACRQIWSHSSANVAAQSGSPTRRDYAEVVEFDKLALELGVFIGLVNHAAKRKGGHAIADYHEIINRTNTAAAAASGSFVIADTPDHDPTDTENRARILAIRGRDLAKEYLLAIEQPKGQSEFVLLGPWAKHKQTQTELALLEELESQPVETWVTTRELATMCGFNPGATQRCISRMMKAGKSTYKHFRIETKPKKGIRLIDMGTP